MGSVVNKRVAVSSFSEYFRLAFMVLSQLTSLNVGFSMSNHDEFTILRHCSFTTDSIPTKEFQVAPKIAESQIDELLLPISNIGESRHHDGDWVAVCASSSFRGQSTASPASPSEPNFCASEYSRIPRQGVETPIPKDDVGSAAEFRGS